MDLLGTGSSCLIRTWGRKPGEGFKMFPLALGDPAQRGHGGKLCGKPPTGSTDTQPSARSLGWAQCLRLGAGLLGPLLSSVENRFRSLGKTLHLPGFRFPQLSKGHKHPVLAQSCLLSLGY